MPLTSKQILDLVASKSSAGVAGKAMAMRRQLEHGRAPGVGSPDQRRFLDAFLERERDRGTQTKPGASTRQRPETRQPYAHPERAARGVPDGTGAKGLDGRTSLEPADIVWMQRLPSDPAKVTYADAVQLASLMQVTKANTADRRLTESIWRPVKALHDLKAAEHELETARQPLPDVPSTAMAALTEAVRAEVPQLTDDEVVVRASTMLRTALDGRSAERDQRIAQAEATIAAVKTEQAQHAALT